MEVPHPTHSSHGLNAGLPDSKPVPCHHPVPWVVHGGREGPLGLSDGI